MNWTGAGWCGASPACLLQKGGGAGSFRSLQPAAAAFDGAERRDVPAPLYPFGRPSPPPDRRHASLPPSLGLESKPSLFVRACPPALGPCPEDGIWLCSRLLTEWDVFRRALDLFVSRCGPLGARVEGARQQMLAGPAPRGSGGAAVALTIPHVRRACARRASGRGAGGSHLLLRPEGRTPVGRICGFKAVRCTPQQRKGPRTDCQIIESVAPSGDFTPFFDLSVAKTPLHTLVNSPQKLYLICYRLFTFPTSRPDPPPRSC
jgi:hypothetical protein